MAFKSATISLVLPMRANTLDRSCHIETGAFLNKCLIGSEYINYILGKEYVLPDFIMYQSTIALTFD